ncbi:MAG: hypothetical protein NTV85_32870 [Hyphomicrobiales bacterium]|nr:hypothetical protein [Hyphomicrobiales bacterium]
MILTAISDPKTVTVQRGPKAGSDMDLLDWTFAIDGGQFEGTEISTSTSMASGPKSKMFGFITALLGGKPPVVGQSFEKTDFVGRVALATIRRDEGGWPRIENLSAVPTAMPKARPTPTTPIAPVPRAVAAAPEASAEQLPF